MLLLEAGPVERLYLAPSAGGLWILRNRERYRLRLGQGLSPMIGDLVVALVGGATTSVGALHERFFERRKNEIPRDLLGEPDGAPSQRHTGAWSR